MMGEVLQPSCDFQFEVDVITLREFQIQEDQV